MKRAAVRVGVLYQVTGPRVCAGLTMTTDTLGRQVVLEAAPILRQWHGYTIETVEKICRRRGLALVRVEES